MPLLDHFHPPLNPRRHWESFHSGWATLIARSLNKHLLPEGYFAEEHAHLGAWVEIDVATFADGDGAGSREVGQATTTVRRATWSPPAATTTLPAAFPDTFEVLVFEEGGARLVAAVQLVSPANKDQPEKRRAFAAKCVSYLAQGISLILVDIVTSRHANLHDEMMAVVDQPGAKWGAPTSLYATAYRPIVREGREEIDVWTNSLALGQPLPTLPLALNAETCVPIDLEVTYAANCEDRRLPE